MKLTLFAVSLRGRKAYIDSEGSLYLECTHCKAIKKEHNFLKEKHGFLNRRYNCIECKNEQNKLYRMNEKRA
ncbi:hypothetical protein AB4X15_15770 [Peribacillus simplex]|uniref:hypothetical protein n=1 Tax=Peribacillus simplex TaxID=1478 RepID=UPI0034E8927E